MPSSHDHGTGGGGEEEDDWGSPLEVGEFFVPDLEFIEIVKQRIFPSLAHELPTTSTLLIWSGVTSSWLPQWANAAIVDSTTTVVSFLCSKEINTLAFWVRCLSRLVMSIVFCVAIIKFLNK